MWKLTDFGISGRTRTNGITTVFSRGTPSYRAPELYHSELARVTEKVDMWALGCVIYECITGLKAFSGDYAVATYSEETTPPFSLPWSSWFWRQLLGSMVQHLLRKDETNRPTPTDILALLDSFRRVIVSPIGESTLSCRTDISYENWVQLRRSCPSELEWLYKLGKEFSLREYDIANGLLEETVIQFLRSIERLHDTNSNVTGLKPFAEDPTLNNTTRVFEKVLDYRLALLEPWIPWVCYEIARYLSSKPMNKWEIAVRICRRGMNKTPTNVIFPMLRSNLYAEEGYYYQAMDIEDAAFYVYNHVSLGTLESTLMEFYGRVLQKEVGYTEKISRLLAM